MDDLTWCPCCGLECESLKVPGVIEKNGNPLLVGDRVRYSTCLSREYIGIIRFGEYQQDGSSGEYNSRKCIGFYIERTECVKMSWDDDDDECWLMPEYQKTISLHDAEWVELIGRKDDVN